MWIIIPISSRRFHSTNPQNNARKIWAWIDKYTGLLYLTNRCNSEHLIFCYRSLSLLINLEDPTVVTMVSQDSSSNESMSVMFHQYTPDMAAGPTNFPNHCCTKNWDGQSSNVLPSIQSLGERIYRSMDLVQSSTSEDSEMFRQRHLMNLQAGKESDDQDFSSALGKGLTLSLYSHLPSDVKIPSFNYREADPIVNQIDPSYLTTGEEPRVRINAYEVPSMLQNHSCSISSNEVAPSLVIWNSRYLKPAQSLLDEVISVIKDVELKPDKQMRKDKSVRRILQDGTTGLRECTKAGKLVHDQTRNTLCSNERSSANNHDIQIRVEKLVALLEEVCTLFLFFHALHCTFSTIVMVEMSAVMISSMFYNTSCLCKIHVWSISMEWPFNTQPCLGIIDLLVVASLFKLCAFEFLTNRITCPNFDP